MHTIVVFVIIALMLMCRKINDSTEPFDNMKGATGPLNMKGATGPDRSKQEKQEQKTKQSDKTPKPKNKKKKKNNKNLVEERSYSGTTHFTPSSIGTSYFQ